MHNCLTNVQTIQTRQLKYENNVHDQRINVSESSTYLLSLLTMLYELQNLVSDCIDKIDVTMTDRYVLLNMPDTFGNKLKHLHISLDYLQTMNN